MTLLTVLRSAIVPISSFTETFASPASTTKWNVGSTVVFDGRLNLPADASYTANLTTTGKFAGSLINSAIYYQMVQPANNAVGAESLFILNASGGGQLRWAAADGGLYARYISPGGVTSDTYIPYDPGTHKWFRIRADGANNVYWDTSVNGVVWTQRYTTTVALNLTSLDIQFVSGGSGGTAIYDNLNITLSRSGSGRGKTSFGFAVGAGDMLAGGAFAINSRLDDIAETGAGWVRTDCVWGWIETTGPGVYDWTNWDTFVNGAKARNLKVLFILDGSPDRVRPASTTIWYGPDTQTMRDQFAAFCTVAVNRYKDYVKHWEVWNEPNSHLFWTPAPSPTNYAALLASAYAAIKAADPTATVITAGTAGVNAVNGDIVTDSWYTQLYAAGIKNNCDGISIHGYQDPNAAVSGNYNTGEAGRVPTIRATMNANGDYTKPMWNTEFGGPTMGPPTGPTGMTETIHRDMVVAARNTWFTEETGPMFAYSLRDLADSQGTRIDSYGWIDLDTRRKLAFTELQTWIAGDLEVTGTTSYVGTATGRSASGGSGSGTSTWTGGAVGRRAPVASAAGTSTWTGAAVGKRVLKGTAAGTSTWTGAAAGYVVRRGAAAGTSTWTGTAAGKSVRKATAVGFYDYNGQARGSSLHLGSGSGAVSYLGFASAGTFKQGVAAGATVWDSTASARTIRRGVATGSANWTGAAVGARPAVPMSNGAASGTWTSTGAATGKRPSGGAVTGTTLWTGAAVGLKPALSAPGSSSATAAGSFTWSGSGIGRKRAAATAVGSTMWTGSARTTVTMSTGFAVSSYLYKGIARGRVPGGGNRNVTATLGHGRSRTLQVTFRNTRVPSP